MISIRFVNADQSVQDIQTEPGQSLMKAAVDANIRGIDRFGRYGGEEFLLVLPGMSTEHAVRALDRLRGIIAELDWSAFSPDMSVTISGGVATLKAEETPDILLARADSALYAAKAQGRNRIASA